MSRNNNLDCPIIRLIIGLGRGPTPAGHRCYFCIPYLPRYGCFDQLDQEQPAFDTLAETLPGLP